MGKKNNKENVFDIFARNMRETPGFKALFELIGIFLFFFIIILVVRIGGANENLQPVNNNKEQETTTTKKVEKELSLYEMLEDFVNKDINIKGIININDITYNVTASNNSSVLTGFLESTSGTVKFKISEGKVYEVKMDTDYENEGILSGVNKDYLIPSSISNLLSTNKSYKEYNNEYILYTYEIEGKTINVTTKNKITGIEIKEGNNIYKLEIE